MVSNYRVLKTKSLKDVVKGYSNQVKYLIEAQKKGMIDKSSQCTEVRFASFLSGGFITATVVNPPERKLAKRTSVQWEGWCWLGSLLQVC